MLHKFIINNNINIKYLLKLLIIFCLSFSFCFGDIDNNKEEKTIIESDRLDRKNEDIVLITGNVNIERNNIIFQTDAIEYNQRTKVIKTQSPIKLFDNQTKNIFFSKEISTTDNFEDSILTDSILLFPNGSSIKSKIISNETKDEYKLKKNEYAVCPTDIYDEEITYEEIYEYLQNRNTPLISLNSSKIFYNKNDSILSLWGTSVWFWKIPIFYIPYLKINRHSNNGIDGLGTPGFEYNKYYGYGVYIPYRISINHEKLNNSFIVLTPKIFYKTNYLLNTKINLEKNNKFKLQLNGDMVNDNDASRKIKNSNNISEEEEGRYEEFRGKIEAEGVYKINNNWKINLDAKILRDRYYYRDYYHDSSSYIQSNVELIGVDNENFDNVNYLRFSNLFYQNLLENFDKYLPKYAPVVDILLQDNIYKNNINNLFYGVHLNSVHLFRDNGVQYDRVSIIPNISNILKSPIGIFNTSFDFRADYYALKNMSNEFDYDNQSRILPQLNVEWRKNLYLDFLYFQPIVKYSVSKKQDEEFDNNIPNEDSKPFILLFENIFSNNRLVGYDMVEYGNRLTYGIEFGLFDILNFGIAQAYREHDYTSVELVGFEEKKSDYVGYTSLIINDYFDVFYKTLINKDNGVLKMNEVDLNFTIDDFHFYTIYSFFRKDIGFDMPKEQISSGFDMEFYRFWKFGGNGIIDIKSDNRLVEYGINLMYDGSCTRWQIVLKQTNPSSSSSRNISINYNFSIKFN